MKSILVSCFAAMLVMGAASLSYAAQNDAGYDAIQQGQWQKAEDQLRAELKATPNEPMRMLNLAYVLQQTGRSKEAAEMYQQVLRLNANPLVAVGPDTDIKGVRSKELARKSMAALADQAK